MSMEMRIIYTQTTIIIIIIITTLEFLRVPPGFFVIEV